MVIGSQKPPRDGAGAGQGVEPQSEVIVVINDNLRDKSKINLAQLPREIKKVYDQFQADLQENNELFLQINSEIDSLVDQKEKLDCQVEEALARREQALQTRRRIRSLFLELASLKSQDFFLEQK